MTTPTEVPAAVKKAFFSGAVAVGITAAIGNFGHVFEAGRYAKQGEQMATVDAVLPDVLLVLCLLKLKYDRRSPWAWAGLVAAVGFIAWASIVTASGVTPGSSGEITAKAVALWPLVVAIIAAGLIETKHAAPEPAAKKSPGSSARTAKPETSSLPKPPAAAKPPLPAAGQKAGQETPPSPGRPLHLAGAGDEPPDELIPAARAAAAKIRSRDEQVTKRSLMAELTKDGVSIGDKRALKLLKEVA